MPKLHHHTFRPWRVKGDTRVVAAESAWRKILWMGKSEEDVNKARYAAGLLQLPRPRINVGVDVFEDWRGPMADSCGDIHLTMIAGFEPRPTVMQDVRVRLLKLIIQTQNLDYLLLTKRPSNALPMLQDAWMQMDSARDPDPRNSRPFELPRNVWLNRLPVLWR